MQGTHQTQHLHFDSGSHVPHTQAHEKGPPPAGLAVHDMRSRAARAACNTTAGL